VKDPNRFYVYVYLDPRKPGHYKYGDYCFLFEPFYIGKGYGERMRKHLYNAKNPESTEITAFMRNKINKIIRVLGIDPITLKCAIDLNEKDAYALESYLIEAMGRFGMDPRGILTNRNFGGKGGNSGGRLSDETKKKGAHGRSLAGQIEIYGQEEGTRRYTRLQEKRALIGRESWESGCNPLALYVVKHGTSHTPENRIKQANAQRGKKRSPETRAKLRNLIAPMDHIQLESMY